MPQGAAAARRLSGCGRIVLVTKTRQAYPDDPDITKTLGILSYRRDYYPQAAELLKVARRSARTTLRSFYYLGKVAPPQLKQKTKCKEILERAFTWTCRRRKMRTCGLLWKRLLCKPRFKSSELPIQHTCLQWPRAVVSQRADVAASLVRSLKQLEARMHGRRGWGR
jgi:hypothetical protein